MSSSAQRGEVKATARGGKSGRFWPIFIIALLVGNVLGAAMLVFFALGDPSHQVEKNYYKKAIAWNGEMAQQRANQALGWRASLSFAAAPDAARAPGARARGTGPDSRLPTTMVVFQLSAADGKPVAGAQLQLECFALRRSARRLRVTLKERKAGRYEAPLLLFPRGLWRFLLRAEKQGKRFTARFEEDVSGR